MARTGLPVKPVKEFDKDQAWLGRIFLSRRCPELTPWKRPSARDSADVHRPSDLRLAGAQVDRAGEVFVLQEAVVLRDVNLEEAMESSLVKGGCAVNDGRYSIIGGCVHRLRAQVRVGERYAERRLGLGRAVDSRGQGGQEKSGTWVEKHPDGL